MEKVNCNICNCENSEPLFEVERYGSSFRIRRCLKCGLVYLSPRPTHDELCKYYSEVYNYGAFLEKAESIKQRCRDDLSLIQKYKKRGNLLEVGCMYGFLLDQAQKYGYNAYGVEISQEAASYARENLGLNVFNCTLEDELFDSQFFDVVFLSHLIEHLEDPKAVMTKIFRLLKNDGVVIILCPNIDSLMAKLMRENWAWLAPPEHLYHFEPRTISKLLSDVGFRKIDITSRRGDLSYLRYISWILLRLLPLPATYSVKYRIVLDNNPQHLSQRTLIGIYKLLTPLIMLLHRLNCGEEILVVATKTIKVAK